MILAADKARHPSSLLQHPSAAGKYLGQESLIMVLSMQLYRWKKEALENFPQLLEDDRKNVKARDAWHERQLNQFWLAKNLDLKNGSS